MNVGFGVLVVIGTICTLFVFSKIVVSLFKWATFAMIDEYKKERPYYFSNHFDRARDDQRLYSVEKALAEIAAKKGKK